MFRVFAQGNDVSFDLPAIAQNATRFFAASLELAPSTEAAEQGAAEADFDSVNLRLAVRVEGAGERTIAVRGRRRTAGDLFDAERAEANAPEGASAGLALLAERCGSVWDIPAEHDRDRIALTLAGVFATVMLGPILELDAESQPLAMFGVRTARTRLAESGAPYR